VTELSDDVKTYIVQELAMYRRPPAVRERGKEYQSLPPRNCIVDTHPQVRNLEAP
jgi:hypothetical protein